MTIYSDEYDPDEIGDGFHDAEEADTEFTEMKRSATDLADRLLHNPSDEYVDVIDAWWDDEMSRRTEIHDDEMWD